MKLAAENMKLLVKNQQNFLILGYNAVIVMAVMACNISLTGVHMNAFTRLLASRPRTKIIIIRHI